jgi:DsbC/DsbD-like thiol-disulfide interchange protein
MPLSGSRHAITSTGSPPGHLCPGPGWDCCPKANPREHRARDGARQLVEAVTGSARLTSPETAQPLESEHVTARAYTDAARFVRWERTRLNVELEIDSGWHIYGRPIPKRYTPLSVEIDAEESLVMADPGYPPVQPFHVEGLDQEFNVSAGGFTW